MSEDQFTIRRKNTSDLIKISASQCAAFFYHLGLVLKTHHGRRNEFRPKRATGMIFNDHSPLEKLSYTVQADMRSLAVIFEIEIVHPDPVEGDDHTISQISTSMVVQLYFTRPESNGDYYFDAMKFNAELCVKDQDTGAVDPTIDCALDLEYTQDDAYLPAHRSAQGPIYIRSFIPYASFDNDLSLMCQAGDISWVSQVYPELLTEHFRPVAEKILDSLGIEKTAVNLIELTELRQRANNDPAVMDKISHVSQNGFPEFSGLMVLDAIGTGVVNELDVDNMTGTEMPYLPEHTYELHHRLLVQETHDMVFGHLDDNERLLTPPAIPDLQLILENQS